MGNPRRDAFEYGMLMTLTGGMVAAYAFLIAYSNQRGPDGERKRLPKVDLDAHVDLGAAWEDAKGVVRGIRWGKQSPAFPGPKASGDATNGVPGGDGAAPSSGKPGNEAAR